MATILEYVNNRVSALRLPLNAMEIEVLITTSGMKETDQMSVDNMRDIQIMILSIIPELMLMPDKTTGDTSLKWDRGAVAKFYSLKCKELDIPDLLSEQSSMTFHNNLY